ncbi:ATP-binding protein [Streptomyces geranii]|uniref:ATP-binding protein n=1 Tax=Streptomyces geranii TaxID=2058923 RepID=UPI000D04613E|nr:LuxR C-terminal-related transcriptional regulator [Streptomyces geranii]
MTIRTPNAGNLFAPLTTFVGRRHDLAEVRRRLGTTRLLTLTGAGGVGKTRLARETAAVSGKAFADGVWWVDLAPIRDLSAVAVRTAEALRLPDLGTQSAADQLTEYLAGRTALLVLDNCEHLAGPCAQLAKTLLAAAPELRILATSRHTLGVSGEQVFTVPPLPPLEAVELLRDRATAVQPGFEISEMNQAHVSRLCAGLDGLPLAIELAASRLRTLSVGQVADRMEDRFALLTGGCPTRLPHQRTLRGMIDWSYELCTPAERVLWNRLSVFAGGFGLEAAEDVCAGDGIAKHEVLDLLDRLVAQSIVLTCESAGLPRFRLLETIRQHGRERLMESGEEQQLRLRHLRFFLDLAERIDWHWYGPGQVDVLARLRAEHTNLLAALDCAADPQARLALTAALRWHWCIGGFLSEGRRQFDRALAAAPEPTPVRAKALLVGIWVAQLQGDLATADRWMDEADMLGEQLDDPVVRGRVVGLRGVSAFTRGRIAESITLYENAWAALTALGDEHEASPWLFAVAVAQTHADDPNGAETARQVIADFEASGERWGRAQMLMTLGQNARDRRDQDQCMLLARSALENMRGFNDYLATANILGLFAWATASHGDHEQAARLLGAVRSLRRKVGITASASAPQVASAHAQCEEAVVRAMGPADYEKALDDGGRHASPGRAIAFALAETDADTDAERSLPAKATPLSRRERQVAELVAQGATNRQIASRLVLSPRTVDGHVENILVKLGYRRRAQIATWWAAHPAPAP